MSTPSSNSIPDDMYEYLQAYLDETDEELETLVHALLTLEDDPQSLEALNEAFRMLHTLKGSSAMMGFEGVAELSHALETRFDQFRSGSLSLDGPTMDVILRCVDFFREFVSQLRAGQQIIEDGSSLIMELEKVGSSEVRPPSDSAAEPSADGARARESSLPEKSSSPEKPAEHDQAATSVSSGSLVAGGRYVRVVFEEGLQLADLKAKLIIARLSNIGEIIDSEPQIDEVQSFQSLPLFTVLLATDRSRDEIIQIAKVDGVKAVEIGDASSAGLAAGLPETPTEPAAPEAVGSSEPPPPSVAVASESDAPDEKAEPPAAQPARSAESLSDSDTQPEAEPQSGVNELPVDEPAESPAEFETTATTTADSEPSLSAPVDDASRPRVAETVRVDIERLDRLMNLTGELIVTNARFHQISGQISPALRNARGASRVSDITERLRDGLARIRQIGDQRSELNGWHHVLDELDEDLESLEDDTQLWDEGRCHFSQIVEAIDQLGRVSQNLQQGVLDTRMVPVGPLFRRFRRVIRDLSNERDKKVQLIIRGEKTELDKRMIDELGDPLLHLIRNSVDHGLESPEARRAAGKPELGTIVLEASHSGNNVFVTVQDDGAGIDVERVRARIIERGLAEPDVAAAMNSRQVIEHIWHPGFSTAAEVTDISGRGVGMDIVKSRVTELNGSIEVSTEPGMGTTFLLRLPLTLAIIRSLMVRYDTGFFTIPIDDVREIVSIPVEQIYSVHGHSTIDVRGDFVPLTAMDRVFEWHDVDYGRSFSESAATGAGSDDLIANVVILQSRGKTLGLCVDELLGGADIVIKSLADNFTSIRGLSGASIMGDGTVCLMLDTEAVFDML